MIPRLHCQRCFFSLYSLALLINVVMLHFQACVDWGMVSLWDGLHRVDMVLQAHGREIPNVTAICAKGLRGDHGWLIPQSNDSCSLHMMKDSTLSVSNIFSAPLYLQWKFASSWCQNGHPCAIHRSPVIGYSAIQARSQGV